MQTSSVGRSFVLFWIVIIKKRKINWKFILLLFWFFCQLFSIWKFIIINWLPSDGNSFTHHFPPLPLRLLWIYRFGSGRRRWPATRRSTPLPRYRRTTPPRTAGSSLAARSVFASPLLVFSDPYGHLLFFGDLLTFLRPFYLGFYGPWSDLFCQNHPRFRHFGSCQSVNFPCKFCWIYFRGLQAWYFCCRFRLHILGY